jgi:hypothetical protein
MTPSEKKAHNNGFILGMASKGVIQKTIIEGAMTDFSSLYTTISPTLENFIKEEEE